MTATCTPDPGPGPSPSGADASQAVTKGFLLSRINGLLLNDPDNTSLLNRSTGQAGPTTTAMLGNGATSVASSGNVFGGAMGLGAGLGNRSGIATDRLGLGASRFDAADADTAGSQTIQFSKQPVEDSARGGAGALRERAHGARCRRWWSFAARL